MLGIVEIELKGTIRSEHVAQVKNLPAIKKRAVGSAKTRKLETVYFDTPDHELRRRSLSLRVRKVGRNYVQCVKQMQNRLGGILVRTEWEGPIPGQAPDISIVTDKRLRRLIQRAGVERLQPIFRTNIQRISRTLKFEDDETIALGIDVGKIIAGNVSEPICEFELELESGTPGRLFELASDIHKEVPFRLANMSKAARGYILLTKDEPQPRKYVKVNLAKDATVEQVLTELVQHCLDHLQANEAAVLATDDPEGVHQTRVALRRLRAALRLFKSVIPKDQYDWAVGEAKWLTGELSASRAWDVLADEFIAPVAQIYGEEQDFDALMAAVEHAKRKSRGRARDAIQTKRYTDFLLRLSTWLAVQAWRNQPETGQMTQFLDPIGDSSMGLLLKRDRAVRKQGRDIASLPEAALHELRLAVKRLRYAVDFFEGLYAKKPIKAYRKRLAKFQDRLGYLCDVDAADILLRELAGEGRNQAHPEWAYVGGITVGWHRHAAIAAKQALAKDMAAFMRTKPFLARRMKHGK